jgi:uncharacterized protein with von Willebrand factor type A (vWA) domain
MEEFKDSLLKYVEIGNEFRRRHFEITTSAKAHNRVCENLAKSLAKERPRTQAEMERNGELSDFVIKCAQLNDQVLGMLDYTHKLLDAIQGDLKAIEAGQLVDKHRMQAETIAQLLKQRDELVKTISDLKNEHRG